MSDHQYKNLVCTKCGKLFTTQVWNISGNPSSTKCDNCKSAQSDKNSKIAGTFMLVVLGAIAAALFFIFTKYKNPKHIAIGFLIFCVSIYIIIKGGFIGFCIVAVGLYFGWKYLKANQTTDGSKTNTVTEIVQDDTNPK